MAARASAACGRPAGTTRRHHGGALFIGAMSRASDSVTPSPQVWASIRRWVTHALDQLTPDEIRADYERRSQAQALILFLLSGTVAGVPVAIGFAAFGAVSLGIAICLTVIVCALAVHLMRVRNGDLTVSQWMVTGSLYAVIVYGLILLGGEVHTANVGWLATVPILGTYLGSSRALGAFWLVITLSTVVALFVARHLGVPFPVNPIANPQDAYAISALCLLLYSGVLGLTIQQSRYLLLSHIHRQARRDSLTGLANRRYFYEVLEGSLARKAVNGSKRQIGLIYLDLDKFKPINDQLGHAAGDHVLKEFARRLSACVRSTDLVARLGGDEFAIFFEDLAVNDVPVQVAKRIMKIMESPIELPSGPVQVETSIGVALMRNQLMRSDQFVARADEALYRAKSSRTQRMCVEESVDCLA